MYEVRKGQTIEYIPDILHLHMDNRLYNTSTRNTEHGYPIFARTADYNNDFHRRRNEEPVSGTIGTIIYCI